MIVQVRTSCYDLTRIKLIRFQNSMIELLKYQLFLLVAEITGGNKKIQAHTKLLDHIT